jgi:hypothetical protein
MERTEVLDAPSHEVSVSCLDPASETPPARSEWRGADPSPLPQLARLAQLEQLEEGDSNSGPSHHSDWDAHAPGGGPSASDEERLAQLAGAVGPLRRVLSAVAARLIETKAYERLCYARLSDYARERAGLSARQLQELAKVHRALAGLPGLERALIEGVLRWSKVRLLARVATAVDEEAWIARARVVSTRQLEREVREHAGGSEAEALDETEPHETVRLRCTPAVREKWSLVREVAERVAGRRLGTGEALELVSAEAFSSLSIDPALAETLDEPRVRARPDPSALDEGDGEPLCAATAAVAAAAAATAATAATAKGTATADAPSAANVNAGADVGAATSAHAAADPGATGPQKPEAHDAARDTVQGFPRAIAALASGLVEADAFELDRRLRGAIRLEQTLDAAMAPLLRIVTSPEFEWRGDYQTLSTYASEQLGMSPSKARALLRLERAGDFCPELRRAYRAGRLSWVKAQCLLPLLWLDIGGEWRPVWVAWACRVTVRRLQQDVERALLLRAGHDRAFQRCMFDPGRAQDPIPESEQQMCAHDVDTEATQELVFRVPVGVAALFFAVRETLRAKLREARARSLGLATGPESPATPNTRPVNRFVTDGEVFEALLDGALRAWTLRDPTARRPDAVIERDGYRCAVPGCTSRCSLHDHHVIFRSAGGSDAPDNRVTLCAFHHQRCLHAGLLGVMGRAPDALVFELGLRPGAPPLVRYRSGDVVVAQSDVDPLVRSQRAA